MAIQVYLCPGGHGPFEVTQRITDPVLPVRKCPRVVGGCEDRDHPVNPTHQHTMHYCGLASNWVPSAPAAVIVEGGTGSGRLMNQRRRGARERFREEQGLE